MNIWKAVGLVYAVGLALIARDKYRKAERPHVDTIEDQLDIAIHATEITERYPFTVIKEQDNG